MTLTRRLWLLGALVPALAMLVALGLAGQLFRYDLERSLDRALLAQAAVESVSLFDGPGQKVHLHMAVSPLLDQVRPFAPHGYLYGPDGTLVVRYPQGPAGVTGLEERLVPGAPGGEPQLVTQVAPDGERWREVRVNVRSPHGERYALRLSASLGQVDGSVVTYYRMAFSLSAMLGLALLVLQTTQARTLARRLAAITRHLGQLREGDFSRAPVEDQERDEIGQLRAVLAEATERLRGARETQERLIAGAAHELRTPLTLMRTSMDLALRRERTPEELRASMLDSRREVDRLAVLAGNLLDLAVAGRGAWDRKRGDLSQLVMQAVEGARAEAERRGMLIRLDAPGPAEASFDAGGLRQAVDNLLSNALKFSPEGGEIHVRLMREGGRYQVRVADLGPGIPQAEREAVFEPFHRVLDDVHTSGTGLGLAIVREVAEQHGGRAYVAPEPRDSGTEMVIEVPVALHAAA
ncbi:HAMP domain-containing histidine kinase [Myxococcus llanfairpwllgwyngyllgogerychwyrndrobwllllantysiliogogogochensis]|uniref:histidine kinase n=1 Tax=Myxococcus llanfairpwllgwyngyllgogerychwyrndrobwllllantysiliogogogochensis TaxID=2590453 RepID=A0A540WVS6_9BACT|nr:HAMP domain-containing sensor histidine kinase [Myxococcus llanfairpwllgwyngyllgogerychwyrndrobwllllantysiliogogogochensis]TQF13122.1 HAMP domain-containing histidine kinase [Myxococcus llanfairpwllgwyngyllgogerychwyrndrobwllllantysiliogogogochensis]